ncbi:peptide chain release factor PrfB2, chloroplastic [Tanacetum coccineum]
MVVHDVDSKLLEELESMGFLLERSIRALHFSDECATVTVDGEYAYGGAEGQHANVKDIVFRLTHIPTSITVACQDERSQQHENKKLCDDLITIVVGSMGDGPPELVERTIFKAFNRQ